MKAACKILGKPSAKPFLDNYVRGDSSDPVILCQKFYRAAQPNAGAQVKNKSIYVPYEVFDLCWDVFEKAKKLVKAIDAVLDDPEHNLIMSEARGLGRMLPNEELFIEELENYRHYLGGLDDFTGSIDRKGFVKISAKAGRQINEMMMRNCFMVARIFDDVFNTEYMDHFGFYKTAGLPYAGPNALQPCVDVLVSMTKTMREIDKQVSLGRAVPDWPSMIADQRYKELAAPEPL